MDEHQRRIDELEAEVASLQGALQAAQRAQAASDARHRLAFEHAPDALLLVSFTGEVEACNGTAQRKLGRDPVGGTLWELFAPGSADAVRDLFGTSMGRSLDQEHRLVDGRVVHLRAAIIPHERVVQVALVDVSNRVALQREVREARRLQAVGELAAGLAHEINNPLTVLQLRLDLLREQVGDPTLGSQLDGLLQHVKRVSSTVHALQAVASPSGREEEVEAAELVQRAVARAEPWLSGVEVTLDVPRPLLLKVRPTRLDVVLVSLLGHAGGAAAAGGGHVTLRLSRNGSGSAVVEIVDDGPPLADVQRHDLSVPQRSEGGRGHTLGLALAWTLVREDGGELTADNVDGEVRLSFSVPMARVGGVSPAPTRDRWRLLLVDDEPALREVLTTWAERKGHHLDAVTSAEEARERVEDHRYDAVIADLRLPGMSGQELVAAWREERPDLARRTVLTSGMLLEDDEQQRFLRKPFTLDRLEQVLSRVVR